MLSIGKLVAGQARYYLDQAQARVDVVDSIGEGLEDYYGGGGSEQRGSWVGSASRELGLERAVAGAELRRVLAGLDPADCVPLRRASSRARVGGFDLTFSATKSVSVVFGLGDTEIRDAVRAAHDVAVREAVGYLERSAAAVRRGHGGAVVEQASELVAAAFGIGRHVPGIRSCTRTSWSRTSGEGATGGGRRWTGGGCIRTHGPRASSTRRCCEPS